MSRRTDSLSSAEDLFIANIPLLNDVLTNRRFVCPFYPTIAAPFLYCAHINPKIVPLSFMCRVVCPASSVTALSPSV